VGLALLDGAAAGEELLHADKALAARITPDSRPAPERTVFFVSISFPPVSAISNVQTPVPLLEESKIHLT